MSWNISAATLIAQSHTIAMRLSIYRTNLLRLPAARLIIASQTGLAVRIG
jgi:hypothetical protein